MASKEYFVQVILHSNDLEALDKVYDGLYEAVVDESSVPRWYENIGHDEKNAVTDEERDEYWEHYGGLKSEGYAHAVYYENAVSESVKDEILKALGIEESMLELEDGTSATYNYCGDYKIGKLTMTVDLYD